MDGIDSEDAGVVLGRGQVAQGGDVALLGGVAPAAVSAVAWSSSAPDSV